MKPKAFTSSETICIGRRRRRWRRRRTSKTRQGNEWNVSISDVNHLFIQRFMQFFFCSSFFLPGEKRNMRSEIFSTQKNLYRAFSGTLCALVALPYLIKYISFHHFEYLRLHLGCVRALLCSNPIPSVHIFTRQKCKQTRTNWIRSRKQVQGRTKKK